MKRVTVITLLLAVICCLDAGAQRRGRGYYNAYYEPDPEQDSILVLEAWAIPVFNRPIDARRYAKLIENLKKVYPIAKRAQAELYVIEENMMMLPTKKEQQAYIKQVEKDLKKEYTPILRKMTYSQGKILIKLIDRQTDHTSYELVRQLRGSFSAFFWQGIARIFGANLKERYDREGEDKVIEQLIFLYEAQLI